MWVHNASLLLQIYSAVLIVIYITMWQTIINYIIEYVYFECLELWALNSFSIF